MTFDEWFSTEFPMFSPKGEFWRICKRAWDTALDLSGGVATGHAESQRNLRMGMEPADTVAYRIGRDILKLKEKS